MLDEAMFFEGWKPVVRTLVLGTLAYALLVWLLRVSGKRTLSKMNAFDFVITVALGSTLATILLSKNVALAQGVAALALLILLQLINTAIAVRWPSYQRVIKARPTLLLYRGEYLSDAMRRQRVTEDEILAAMRQQGVAEPAKVDAVVLETEGSLSVLRQGADSAEQLAQFGVEVDGQ